MTTTTFSAAPYNGVSTTGTEIRAWVQAIHTALTAIGLVQTADTGQINPATVTNAAATDTESGYEVWRFNDTLQATAPVFVRIGYGRANGTTCPQLWVTVGKGTDGAGTITGVLIPRTRTGGSDNSGTSTTTATGYASSGDGSMLALFPFIMYASGAPTAALPGFVLDRSRDASGAPTGDGVSLAVRGSTVSPVTLASSATPTGLPALTASSYATGAVDVGVIPVLLPYTLNGVVLTAGNGFGAGILAPVFPWTCYAPGVAPWQSLAAVSYAGADDPGGVFTVFIAGQERTYRSIPISRMQCGWGVSMNPEANQVSTYVGVAILWE